MLVAEDHDVRRPLGMNLLTGLYFFVRLGDFRLEGDDALEAGRVGSVVGHVVPVRSEVADVGGLRGYRPLLDGAAAAALGAATALRRLRDRFSDDFENKDAGVPHNVAIHKDSASGQEVFKGDIFNGPGKRTYSVPALPAGTYAFACSVHPNMTGTLTVK